ncbi:MAG TPA: peptide ABC transporter substrate-binding protein [Gemmatimonadaceae bacterium]|nr:peptide ABC transporter substrate-binding protein [Gemmatimonadaceae bacterium]
MNTSRWLCGLALASAFGCSDRPGAAGTASGDVGGTLIITQPGAEPTPLFPPFSDDEVSRMIVDQIYDRLATIPKSLNTLGDAGWEPRLAKSWAWSRDSLSIAFNLDPRARWHDGRPVRASDVVFSFALVKDPQTGTQLTPVVANIDSVTLRDSLTAVAWFHRRTPEQFYDFAYQVYILPEHVLKDVPRATLRTSDVIRRPVGTGRFRFVQWVPSQRIEIIADTGNFRGRAKLDRVLVSFATDPGVSITQLLTGQADFMSNVPIPLLPRVDSSPNLRILRYGGSGFSYLGLNLRDAKGGTAPHPIFSDRRVRRAIAMSLDRQGMLKNVFDTLGVLGLGPFARALMDTTVTQPKFDRAAAAALLDSAGWRMGPDSVRVKNGRRLTFAVLTPTSSSFRMRYAVLIQEQLKAVGIHVEIDPVDINNFVNRTMEHQFDAALFGTGSDPSRSSIKQNWGTEGIAKGGQNAIGYSNRAFDAMVDSATTTFDKRRSDALYHRAFQTLVDDAPAVFLYDIANLAGVHKRVRVQDLRAEAWWTTLPDWWIPAGERIERDRIGLRSAQQ